MPINQLIEYLQTFGLYLNINEDSSPLLLLSLSILVLSLVAFFCILNIIIYLTILYLSENEILKSKIFNHKILKKIYNFYRHTRVYYIIIEFIFVVYILSTIIYICYRIVTAG